MYNVIILVVTKKLPNLIPTDFSDCSYTVLNFMFGDCRITFLCWGCSGLASSRGAGGILGWTAVTDTLRGY